MQIKISRVANYSVDISTVALHRSLTTVPVAISQEFIVSRSHEETRNAVIPHCSFLRLLARKSPPPTYFFPLAMIRSFLYPHCPRSFDAPVRIAPRGVANNVYPARKSGNGGKSCRARILAHAIARRGKFPLDSTVTRWIFDLCFVLFLPPLLPNKLSFQKLIFPETYMCTFTYI